AVLAGRDHIEATVTIEIGDGEVNAEALTGADGAEIDHMLRERFAGPFEHIPAVRILVAFVAMRVSAESFTGDELALAVTVYIDQLQIVILAAERIDFVARTSAFAGSVDVLLPPPQSVGVTFAEDEFVFAVT